MVLGQGGEHTAERTTTITGIVENAPEAERQRIVKIADEAGLRVFRSAQAAIEDARNGGWQTNGLCRAFTSLIYNAVNHGHRARVSLSDEGDAVPVTIDDDGPGVSGRPREEAFKPFRRLDTSRSAETGGTGLGLTVARTIVRAHGGDIVLGNRPEHGLRAEIVLPR